MRCFETIVCKFKQLGSASCMIYPFLFAGKHIALGSSICCPAHTGLSGGEDRPTFIVSEPVVVPVSIGEMHFEEVSHRDRRGALRCGKRMTKYAAIQWNLGDPSRFHGPGESWDFLV